MRDICFVFVNTGNLADERLGGSDDDRIWNANDIGMKMTIGYAIGMYLLLKGETNKLLIYGLMALILLVALMSGSKGNYPACDVYCSSDDSAGKRQKNTICCLRRNFCGCIVLSGNECSCAL